MLVSGWYPERDYWVLIAALVKTIDAATVGGDVWRSFARFSAKRDYLEEYGHLVGIDVSSTVTRSTANGDPFCEWEHRLGRTPATKAYVASLPSLTDS